MAFPPLGNSNYVLISSSLTFRQTQKKHTPFHHIAYDYSFADHLRDVLWEDIFKFSPSVAASEFCKWVQVPMIASS